MPSTHLSSECLRKKIFPSPKQIPLEGGCTIETKVNRPPVLFLIGKWIITAWVHQQTQDVNHFMASKVERKVSRSVVSDSFATPWTVAYQAPPSMGFSKQGYWSGLPFPSPGDLPNPGIEPGSPKLQADALPSEPPINFLKISQN